MSDKFNSPIKAFWGVASSLRAAVWLVGLQLCVLMAGAFQMPAMKVYSSMNSQPLLEWLRTVPLSVSWWLWASVGILALLALNTVACGLDSLLKKGRGRAWLLVVSPQAIHMGFLLMLFAHLLSAVGGERAMVVATAGQSFSLQGGKGVFTVGQVRQELSNRGMPLDYYADADFYGAGGDLLKQGRIAPNRPVFFGGMGFYIKEVRGDSALLEVAREPGALVALAGGVFFSLGVVALLGLKMERER